MPTASVNGTNLNYRQAGRGEDLILIHGLAANHAFWNLNLLLPLARMYRVTVFDLRGHGYSEMPLSGYTSPDMVEDLVGLMDHLQIERAHLTGHSFGGVVALHCATLYPQRVSSLTLADSRVRALQPRHRLKDWPDWRQVKAKLQDHGISIDENQDDVGVTLLEKIASPQWRARRQWLSKNGLFVPFGGWAGGSRSAERWIKLLETTTARQDIVSVAGLTVDRIGQVRQPTLAIYGERSRCLKTFEELPLVLPRCTNVIVPGAGHFYPLSKPVFVAKILTEFLGSLHPVSRPAPAARGMTKDLPASRPPAADSGSRWSRRRSSGVKSR